MTGNAPEPAAKESLVPLPFKPVTHAIPVGLRVAEWILENYPELEAGQRVAVVLDDKIGR